MDLGDLKKSITDIIFERTTSPLYGTLILSWLVWNWKILYLTLFISQDKINITKIEYIENNCNDINYLLWYPLASTIVFICIVPLFSNGAFWINAIYTKWRVNKKNQVDGGVLLTTEQSVKLRMKLAEQEKTFYNSLSEKENEISDLNTVIDQMRKQEGGTNDFTERVRKPESVYYEGIEFTKDMTSYEFVDKIKDNKKLVEDFKIILDRNYNGKPLRYFIANGVEEKSVNLAEFLEFNHLQSDDYYQLDKANDVRQRLSLL